VADGAGGGIGLQGAVDGVGDVPLERAERFGVGLAVAATPLVVLGSRTWVFAAVCRTLLSCRLPPRLSQ